MLTVNVNYYHRLRDLTGRQSERLHLDHGATVVDLKNKLLCSYTDMLPLQNSLLIARNNEYADPTEELVDGDVVDVMPPVSGG